MHDKIIVNKSTPSNTPKFEIGSPSETDPVPMGPLKQAIKEEIKKEEEKKINMMEPIIKKEELKKETVAKSEGTGQATDDSEKSKSDTGNNIEEDDDGEDEDIDKYIEKLESNAK